MDESDRVEANDHALHVYADLPEIRVAGKVEPDELDTAFERAGIPWAAVVHLLERISHRVYAERNERLVAFVDVDDRSRLSHSALGPPPSMSSITPA
jgi:hypothetical protein